ncbi:MAG: choice-of-anchor D domain-containing protein [Verrucomicrobiota bacterium]
MPDLMRLCATLLGIGAVATSLPAQTPVMAVEQPPGTNIADTGTKNFNTVLVGSSTTLTFTIKNTGDGDLTGLTITKGGTHAADFTVTSNPSAPVSGPSGTTTFNVRFTPSAVGARSAAIHIANNDATQNPFDIILTGKATLTKSIGAVWFIGDSITQSNADGDGNGSPRKSLYDLLTANGYTFTFTGHYTANVDGLPTTGDTPDTNLYQYHSGISGSVIGSDLSGRTGMTQNMSSFWTSGRLATVKPDVVLIMLGTNDVDQAVDLANAPARLTTLLNTLYAQPGVGAPRVMVASIPPNRTSAEDPANTATFNSAVPGVVNAQRALGRNVSYVDQFTPLETAYVTNMMGDNLHTNATGNASLAQQWFNAIASVPPSAPAISVALPSNNPLTSDSSSINFGSVLTGAQTTLVFTVKNTGMVILSSIKPSKDGTNAGDYVIATTPATSMNAGGSSTFRVTFLPTAAGTRVATLHIASNASISPFNIALIGTGTGTTLQAWRVSQFGSADNSGDGADLNDYDHDGLPNLIEYAFGLNPKQSDAGSLPQLPQLQQAAGSLVFSFTHPPGISDITYGAEWSPTLLSDSWTPVADTSTPPQHTFSVPGGTYPQLFMRLRVTHP